MSIKRSYEDSCAAAHALDLVGERWALLIARELMLGPKRFTDLRASLPGISSNVLTQRLTELEQGAVLRKRKLGPPVSTWVYELTDWGRELEPIIIQLGQWGVRSPAFVPHCAISATSLALSFKAMFRPDNAQGVNARYALHLGNEQVLASVTNGQIEISRHLDGTADATIETTPNILASIIYGGRDLNEAVQSGELKMAGDQEAVDQFLTFFKLPA
jgi:DNA-binding HxlR family transcriptional regulator/putative sterol carrier protein